MRFAMLTPSNSPSQTMERPVRRQARHARSVLIWTALLFGSAQLGGGLLLDYAWPLLRFPSLGTIVTRLQKKPDWPLVVFLGSSRFGCGIREDEISSLMQRE